MREKIRAEGSTEQSILPEHSRWFEELDLQSRTKLPDNLAKNITIALRMQTKVEEALMAGHRPRLLKTISMLNCRKSVEAVLEKRSIRELTRGQKNPNLNQRETAEEVAGVDALIDDVERLLEMRKTPPLGTHEHMGITEYLDDHVSEIPAVVHVFNIRKKFLGHFAQRLISQPDSITGEMCRTQLNRDHTFIVLGKNKDGDYVCFHKRGPSTYHPFEVVTIDSLTSTALNPEAGRLYVSFIGPLDN